MIESLLIRERLEQREQTLSPFASRSRDSHGRLRHEEPCPMRTAYQRDRDRIIHCKAFRRLKHKTQVHIAPLGDHYVTRLTHTLEVAQIARSIARALNLNEDLAEAISLGHDLGHTPFGHVGEEALDALCPGGFRHYEQSLRVVDMLERDGQGLNLTWEVRDGILHHSKGRAEIMGPGWGEVATLEGEVCKVSDIVAYVNHDTADAIRANMISEADLPAPCVATLGDTSSKRINTMVVDIVENSWDAAGPESKAERPAIRMGSRIAEAVNILRQFLFERVYGPSAEREDSRHARRVVAELYRHFTAHPELLPAEYCLTAERLERKVADYIAGMTDQYALRLADRIAAGTGAGQGRP